MQRFKNIVLLYECSHVDLENAITLARENQANLTVVQVVKPPTDKWETIDIGGQTYDLRKMIINELETSLKSFIAPAEQKYSRITTKIMVGIPSVEIIRDVIANKRDLLIIPPVGKDNMQGDLLGSTIRHLLRQCPCPIWILKRTQQNRLLRIMAAIDPTSENNVGETLNATILQLAASLAAKRHSELHVVHAWTLFAEPLLRGLAGVSELEISRLEGQEFEKQRRTIDSLLTRYTGGVGKVHLVKGTADSVIPELATNWKIDLLVMGTVCRTGISGFFIGNTAETILDEIDCSVLTVKPEGFQSAVQLT